MIIKLDWRRCHPRTNWEEQIHFLLEDVAALKSITQAVVSVEEVPDQSQRFRLRTLLCVPGPDVQADAFGHTFEEALLKLRGQIQQRLRKRQSSRLRSDGAARGVKAMHRG